MARTLEPPKRTPKAFNMSRDDFEALWRACGGRCPLCQKPFTHDRRRPAALDHEHKSGQVRGLICRQCNWLIGLLHDNVEWIERVANYLRHWPIKMFPHWETMRSTEAPPK